MGCYIFIWKGLMLRLLRNNFTKYQLTSIDSRNLQICQPDSSIGWKKVSQTASRNVSPFFRFGKQPRRKIQTYPWLRCIVFWRGVLGMPYFIHRKKATKLSRKSAACVWTTLPSLPTEVNNNMPKDLWHVELPLFVEFDNRIKLEIPYTRRWITQSSFSIIWDEMIELGLQVYVFFFPLEFFHHRPCKCLASRVRLLSDQLTSTDHRNYLTCTWQFSVPFLSLNMTSNVWV